MNVAARITEFESTDDEAEVIELRPGGLLLPERISAEVEHWEDRHHLRGSFAFPNELVRNEFDGLTVSHRWWAMYLKAELGSRPTAERTVAGMASASGFSKRSVQRWCETLAAAHLIELIPYGNRSSGIRLMQRLQYPRKDFTMLPPWIVYQKPQEALVVALVLHEEWKACGGRRGDWLQGTESVPIPQYVLAEALGLADRAWKAGKPTAGNTKVTDWTKKCQEKRLLRIVPGRPDAYRVEIFWRPQNLAQFPASPWLDRGWPFTEEVHWPDHPDHSWNNGR